MKLTPAKTLIDRLIRVYKSYRGLHKATRGRLSAMTLCKIHNGSIMQPTVATYVIIASLCEKHHLL